MLKKLFIALILSFICILIPHNFSLAQSDVNVDLTTGGTAKCVFNGKVPFRSIKAANNNFVLDALNATAQVLIDSAYKSVRAAGLTAEAVRL